MAEVKLERQYAYIDVDRDGVKFRLQLDPLDEVAAAKVIRLGSLLSRMMAKNVAAKEGEKEGKLDKYLLLSDLTLQFHAEFDEVMQCVFPGTSGTACWNDFTAKTGKICNSKDAAAIISAINTAYTYAAAREQEEKEP